MFGNRYFGARYFGDRWFAPGGGEAAEYWGGWSGRLGLRGRGRGRN